MCVWCALQELEKPAAAAAAAAGGGGGNGGGGSEADTAPQGNDAEECERMRGGGGGQGFGGGVLSCHQGLPWVTTLQGTGAWTCDATKHDVWYETGHVEMCTWSKPYSPIRTPCRDCQGPGDSEHSSVVPEGGAGWWRARQDAGRIGTGGAGAGVGH
jgi:hypothetical protein